MNEATADGLIIASLAGTIVFTTIERVTTDTTSRGPTMTVVIGGVLVAIPLLILADIEPGLAAAFAGLIFLGSVVKGGQVFQVAANILALKPGDVSVGSQAADTQTPLTGTLGKSVPLTGGLSALGSSGTAATVIAQAMSHLGDAYSRTPNGVTTFDCSLLVQDAMAAAGVNIGRDTFTQVKQGIGVAYGDMKPGDLIFEKGISPTTGQLVDFGHVVMYVGNGKVIQAQKTGTNVMLSPAPAAGAVRRRPSPAAPTCKISRA